MKTLQYIIRDGARITSPNEDIYRHDTVWVSNRTPSYDYTNSVSEMKNGKWRCKTRAHGTIFVPKTCNLEEIDGVYTIVPKDWKSSRGCVECWVLVSSRGDSFRIENSFLHVPTLTHGKSRKACLIGAKKKKIADKINKLLNENLEDQALKSKKVVDFYAISRRSGNCHHGTINFLQKLGVTMGRTGTIRAMTRLVKRNGLFYGSFKRACALALVS